MSDAKKPKAKPLSLYPMSFEEAVRRAIDVGRTSPESSTFTRDA